MSLRPGTRVGPYDVISPIGVGGMGEVYRARDSKLNRDVAIKTLPAEFSADRDRLARFKREAQTLAVLNHPNIAHVYGLEDANGTSALVMELVEGPTLADVIARSTPELDDALAIARQIADALAAAHEQGIVHRDLKPANVKVRPDGTVKVLDFGLAKAAESASASGAHHAAGHDLFDSPTVTSPAMTKLGMILGTAAYMSPEQAKGRGVDKRGDMWAFGAVLFEMISGHRAFPGEDVTDTLANVLKTEPDWSLLPADLPPRVRQVIRACLRKNPRERLADAQDARLALDGIFDVAGVGGAMDAPPAAASRRAPAAAVLVTAVVAASIGAAATWFLGRDVPPPASAKRLSLVLPAERAFFQGGYPHRGIAISPDGTQIVYTARDPNALTNVPSQLAIRSIDSLAVRDIAGATSARQPFFSPDGQWIAFFTVADGALKKIRLAGGSAVTLVEGINGTNWCFGVWTDDDRIVFGGGSADGLGIVSAAGGKATSLTQVDTAKNEIEHLAPAIATPGRAALFTVRYTTARQTNIEAVSLDGGARRLVVENASSPFVLPSGHLLFQRDETTLVAPFDLERVEITGPAEPLVDSIRRDLSITTMAQLAVSRTGHLAYFPSIDNSLEIGLVARTGEFTRLDVPAGTFDGALVSRIGRQLAYTVRTRTGGNEVHVRDLVRGGSQKLTLTGDEIVMAWHPTKPALAVTVSRDQEAGVVLRGLDGSDRFLIKHKGTDYLRNGSWSPDGKLLAYTVQTGSLHDIWIASVGDTVETKAWLNSTTNEHSPRFSPSGRWMAYVGQEPGQSPQVLVRGYPTGDRMAVSVAGGQGPLWSRDGREIFFHGTHEGVVKLMRVSVTESGGSLTLGRPEPLFEMRHRGPSGIEPYSSSSNGGVRHDVMPDGKHFVMIKATGSQEAREIVVVENWIAELGKK